MYFFQLKSDPLRFHFSSEKPLTKVIELYECDEINELEFNEDDFDTCRDILEHYEIKATDLSPGEYLYRKKEAPSHFVVSSEPPSECLELYKTHELMGALTFVHKDIISRNPYTFKVVAENGVTYDEYYTFKTCKDLVYYLDDQCRESLGYYTYIPGGLKNMGDCEYMRDFWFYSIP